MCFCFGLNDFQPAGIETLKEFKGTFLWAGFLLFWGGGGGGGEGGVRGKGEELKHQGGNWENCENWLVGVWELVFDWNWYHDPNEFFSSKQQHQGMTTKRHHHWEVRKRKLVTFTHRQGSQKDQRFLWVFQVCWRFLPEKNTRLFLKTKNGWLFGCAVFNRVDLNWTLRLNIYNSYLEDLPS